MIATGIAISSGQGVAIDDDAEKPDADRRSHHQATPGHRHGHRRVPGAQLIADPPERRAPLFGLLHDPHDLRVAGIGGDPDGANRQRRVAVDRARQHPGAGPFRDPERLAGQIRLVHRAAALHDLAVDRADLVRQISRSRRRR